jgi:hypothetical protein
MQWFLSHSSAGDTSRPADQQQPGASDLHRNEGCSYNR